MFTRITHQFSLSSSASPVNLPLNTQPTAHSPFFISTEKMTSLPQNFSLRSCINLSHSHSPSPNGQHLAKIPTWIPWTKCSPLSPMVPWLLGPCWCCVSECHISLFRRFLLGGGGAVVVIWSSAPWPRLTCSHSSSLAHIVKLFYPVGLLGDEALARTEAFSLLNPIETYPF